MVQSWPEELPAPGAWGATRGLGHTGGEFGPALVSSAVGLHFCLPEEQREVEQSEFWEL